MYTMDSIRNLGLLAIAFIGLTSAAPAEITTRQTFVPGTLNNTQEFYIRMKVTEGLEKYNGWLGTPSRLIYFEQVYL